MLRHAQTLEHSQIQSAHIFMQFYVYICSHAQNFKKYLVRNAVLFLALCSQFDQINETGTSLSQ